MARKRRSEPEDEGSGYSWMDTYGDLVTLLLCFFVLLFSFSSVDSAKWKALVAAFSGGSSIAVIENLDPGTVRASEIPDVAGYPRSSDQDDPNPPEDSAVAAPDEEGDDQGDIEATFNELYINLRDYIAENRLENQLYVEKDGDIITLRFIELLLFESGRAEILESSHETLNNAIDVLAKYESAIKDIRIEGHTDNVPINNAEFENNWELSQARSYAALQYFLGREKIDFMKLSIAGYGEYRPIDDNDTEAGRAKNRRVDFVIERAVG